jgi:hypothetical protein
MAFSHGQMHTAGEKSARKSASMLGRERMRNLCFLLSSYQRGRNLIYIESCLCVCVMRPAVSPSRVLTDTTPLGVLKRNNAGGKRAETRPQGRLPSGDTTSECAGDATQTLSIKQKCSGDNLINLNGILILSTLILILLEPF